MDNRQAEFVKFLTSRRLEMSLSVSDLAFRSGVPERDIAKIELGQQPTTADVVQKIAQPLGMKEDDIFMMVGYLTRLDGFDYGQDRDEGQLV